MATIWITCRLVLNIMLSVLLLCSTQAKNDIRVNYFNCEWPKNGTTIVSKLVCRLYNAGLPNPMIHGQVILTENMSEFIIRVKLSLIRKNNSPMTLLDVDINGCDYLIESRSNFQIIGKYRKQLRRRSNLPNNCPLLANTQYEIRNLTVKSNDFAPGAPKKKWNLIVRLMRKNKFLFQGVFNGEFM